MRQKNEIYKTIGKLIEEREVEYRKKE